MSNRIFFSFVVSVCTVVSCSSDWQINELRNIDVWELPECISDEDIIDFKEINAIGDWGVYSHVQLDSSCLYQVIRVNNLKQDFFNGDTVFQRIKYLNDISYTIRVTPKKNVLFLFYYEE